MLHQGQWWNDWMYHNRMRNRQTRAGRFMSRDPLGVWGDPFNLGNASTFVGNNPWSRRDPYGDFGLPGAVVGGIIGGIGGGIIGGYTEGWRGAWAGAGGGLVSGAIYGSGGGLLYTAVLGAASGVLGDTISQTISGLWDGKSLEGAVADISTKEQLVAGGTGAAFGILGRYAGSLCKVGGKRTATAAAEITQATTLGGGEAAATAAIDEVAKVARRSATVKRAFLRDLAEDWRTPQWQKEWLRNGRNPLVT